MCSLELGPLHHARRLIAHPAEHEGPAALVQGVREVLERVQSRSVDGCHVAEPQHHDAGQIDDAPLELQQLVGCPEEKWTVNAVDRDTVGNLIELQAVRHARR